MDTLNPGGRIDGHGKHLTPLGRAAQVGVGLDERLFWHAMTIAQVAEARLIPIRS